MTQSWVGFLLLAVVLYLTVHQLGGADALKARFGGALLLPFVLALHVVLSVVASPLSYATAMAHGILGGALGGPILTWAGWMIGIAFASSVPRFHLTETELARALDRLPPRLRERDPHDARFLIGARLTAATGSEIVNSLPAHRGVTMRRHLACAAVGILPSSLIAPLVAIFVSSFL